MSCVKLSKHKDLCGGRVKGGCISVIVEDSGAILLLAGPLVVSHHNWAKEPTDKQKLDKNNMFSLEKAIWYENIQQFFLLS